MSIIDSSICTLFVAFVISVLLGPKIISILHKFKFGQNIRGEGPKSHIKKSGTPTMGGIIFIIGIIISMLIMSKFNSTMIMLLFVTLGFGLIGFIDDYIKVVKKRSLGLTPSQKIVGQFIIATVFAFFIVNEMGIGTSITVPFLNSMWNLKWAYIPFIIFVVIATVNSVNLTDGLDGLASSVTVPVSIFFGIIAFACASTYINVDAVDYKNISIFAASICGGLFGFLCYNSYPAKVFMGDTGSLALGGAISAMAVLLKNPIILVVVGFVYMAESLSVIIQVISFKLTGKRVFKMSPIHHHFELCGWSETRIVTIFSIVTAILCMGALITIK